MCAQKGVPWQSHTVRQHQYYKATWTLCMDLIKPDESGTKDIILIADRFTKYVIAIATCNQKPSTVAKCLWDIFIVPRKVAQ